MTITIEVCVDSVESATAAVNGGANRLEVCANLAHGGGTTPSFGLVSTIRMQHLSIPLMVMIRPRTGDFVYSRAEIEVMREDVRFFSTLGIAGVVFGMLLADGQVDAQDFLSLAQYAKDLGLQVCYHRAFDMARDIGNEGTSRAVLQIIRSGFVTRILTSGGGKSAPASVEELKAICGMVNSFGSSESSPAPPIVLPGSGINSETVGPLLTALLPYRVREVHLSGGSFHDSVMQYRKADMGMGEWCIWRTDEERVRAVREVVDRVWQDYDLAMGR